MDKIKRVIVSKLANDLRDINDRINTYNECSYENISLEATLISEQERLLKEIKEIMSEENILMI